MFDLSMTTAILIAVLANFVGLVTAIITFMRFKNTYRSIFYFIMYFLLSSLGIWVLLIKVDFYMLATVFSYESLVIGTLMLLVGYRSFFNTPLNKIGITVLMAVYTVLILIFSYIYPNANYRSLVFSIFLLVIHIHIVLYLHKKEKEEGWSLNISSMVHIFFIMFLAVRVISIIIYVKDASLLVMIDSLVVYFSSFGTLLIVSSMISVILEKIKDNLDESSKAATLFAEIYHNSTIPTLLGNSDGEVFHFNQSLIDFVGMSEEELSKLSWKNGFMSEEDVVTLSKMIENVLKDGKEIVYETELLIGSAIKKVEITVTGFFDGDDRYFISFIQDITKLIENEQRYIQSELDKASILQNIPGFAYRCLNDQYWTMQLLSDSFSVITGYSSESIIGNTKLSYNDLILPEYQEEVRNEWQKAVETHSQYTGEYMISKKDGSVIWVWEQGRATYDSSGNVTYLEGFVSDITYRKEVEHALEFLSYHDSLTGLYNRRFIEAEIERLDVKRNVPFSIMKLDIDGLKFANDVFGHSYGDKLIQEVSNVLKEVLRQDEIIARVGGDEFMVLLPSTPNSELHSIVNRLNSGFEGSKLQTEVSVSIGCMTKELLEENIQHVIQQADEEMYSNKLFKKPMVARNSANSILNMLYTKFPQERSIVQKVIDLTMRIGTHLNYSSIRLEKLRKAAELSRVGMISEHQHGPVSCIYHSEDAFRIVNAIPDYGNIANIIVGICEHYDGMGHPKGYKREMISTDSQILALSLFIVIHGYEDLKDGPLKAVLDDKSSSWFNPLLVNEYYRMVS